MTLEWKSGGKPSVKKSPAFQPKSDLATTNEATPAPNKKEARARVTSQFLADLATDYSQHGAGAIRILRVERPHEYIKCVAALLPREDVAGLSEGLVVNIVRFSDSDTIEVFSRPSAIPGSDDGEAR
jgi:hypothetical protein